MWAIPIQAAPYHIFGLQIEGGGKEFHLSD